MKEEKEGLRAGPSDPKRTEGKFRCRVSIDRSTHPPSFIRPAGCHTSLWFPGRCHVPVWYGSVLSEWNRHSYQVCQLFIAMEWQDTGSISVGWMFICEALVPTGGTDAMNMICVSAIGVPITVHVGRTIPARFQKFHKGSGTPPTR